MTSRLPSRRGADGQECSDVSRRSVSHSKPTRHRREGRHHVCHRNRLAGLQIPGLSSGFSSIGLSIRQFLTRQVTSGGRPVISGPVIPGTGQGENEN